MKLHILNSEHDMKMIVPLLLLALCLVPQPGRADLNPAEQKIVDWVDEHVEDAITLLETSVNISSGTMNHEGVREVGELLGSELEQLGLETEWIDMQSVNRAGHLIGRQDGSSGRKMLLIGHLDTVFESVDGEQSFVRDGNLATGPGISDMKSGNVVIIYALKALNAAGLLNESKLVVIFTGDEEKSGSPKSISRAHLVEAGKWADVALGFEEGVTYDGSDWATIARRSSTGFKLEVTGIQSHSSQIFSDDVGAGAIFEISRILAEFYNQLTGEDLLTFNVGAIAGGTVVEYDAEQNRGSAFGKTNVVPNTAIAQGGIRTITQEQLERTRDAMRAIVAAHLPQTSAVISFTDGYPPMSPSAGNKDLQERFSAINVDLGRDPMPALDPGRRGAADISFVAPYTDALAGLGALGEGGHTPHESLELDSLALATKRAAIMIYRLSQE